MSTGRLVAKTLQLHDSEMLNTCYIIYVVENVSC